MPKPVIIEMWEPTHNPGWPEVRPSDTYGPFPSREAAIQVLDRRYPAKRGIFEDPDEPQFWIDREHRTDRYCGYTLIEIDHPAEELQGI